MPMNNRDLYNAALRLLAESIEDGENEDFEERAPYLLAAFCSDTTGIQRQICLSEGKPEPGTFTRVCLDLDEKFPYSERLASAAGYYLAAMLILDLDENRSDTLYDKYCDTISSISDTLPARSESIVNRYL